MRSATDGMSNRSQGGMRTSVVPATRPSTVCDGFPIKRITFDLPSMKAIWDRQESRQSLIRPALGNYESYVVVLFVRAEVPNFIHNGSKHDPRRQFTMSAQRLDQVLLSKFLSGFIERVGYPVRVQYQSVSRE